MAFSTATPYGFRPVGLLSGRVYNAAYRLLPIASAYGTSIGQGDAVKLVAGQINKDTGTTAMTPVGIFMGCYFTDPNSNQPSYHQYWTASTVASDALAYVVDDPDVVFQIQSDGPLNFDDIGGNAAVNGTAPLSNPPGLSQITLNSASVANTATLPVRIIDFVGNGYKAQNDTYPDLLCIWNWGMHQYRNATGEQG